MGADIHLNRVSFNSKDLLTMKSISTEDNDKLYGNKKTESFKDLHTCKG